MPSKFGGVPANQAPQSKFGGVAVEDQPSAASASAPSQPDLDKFMQSRYSGPNRARNERLKNQDRGLTPQQIYARHNAVESATANAPGMGDINEGISNLQAGEYKKGAHNLLVGEGKLGSVPLIAGSAAAAGIGPTALALGTGAVTGAAGKYGSKLLGAGEDTSNLIGDATAIAGGGAHDSDAANTAREFGASLSEKFPATRWLKSVVDETIAKRNARLAGKPVPAPQSAAPAPAPAAPTSAPKTAVIPPARQLPAASQIQQPGISPSIPASPIAAPVPGKDTSGVIKGWKPNILPNENAPVPAPQPVPPAAMSAEDEAALDQITKNMGGSKFKFVTDKGLRQTYMDALAKDKARAAGKPIPAPTNTAAAAGTAPVSAPKPAPTNIQPPVAQPPSVAKPSPMNTETPVPAQQNQVHNQDLIEQGYQERKAIRQKGATDADSRVLLRIRERFPNLRPQQFIDPTDPQYIDDGQLDAHRVDAGGRAVGKSGAQGRKPDVYRHELAKRVAESSGGPSYGPAQPSSPQAPPPPAAAQAQETPPQSSGPINGVQAVVRTPAGTKANVQYKISEAPDIKTSFDPDYDATVGHQPRDTSRVGSRQRVEQRKADMDPEAMGPSRMAGDGAPITRQGNAVTRNHGAQALKEIYAEGKPKATEYKQFVQEHANLAGMTPEQVGNMKAPILHRELMEDWQHPDVKRFADEANQSSVARMSDSELAQQMAGKMTGGKMDAFNPSDDGLPNPEFVRGMIADFPAEEQAQFFDRGGAVSQTGARLIRNAVFAKAYENPAAIERMSESTDSQVRNISNGMLKAAPEFAKLQEAVKRGDAHDLSISNEVGKAMETLDNLRTNKKNVKDWLAQQTTTGRDAVVDVLVDTLAREARRPNVIRDTLRNYASSVLSMGSPKQQGIFGDSELPSKLDLFERAYSRAKADYTSKAKFEPSMFEEAK